MSFAAFLKKEFLEAYRTPKGIILGVVFLFFGILSPLSAKYMNEILAAFGQQQGIKIQLPPPTYLQSYEQFFKNIYFMMTVVIVLVLAGAVAEEKARGTIILVLTKSLSRNAFILGKLISALIIFTASYAAATGVCILYTALMFPKFMGNGIILALLMYWLFGSTMITLTTLVSILSKSMPVAVVGGFACYAIISAVANIPYIGKYTPGILQGLSYELIHNTKSYIDVLCPSLIAVVLCIVAIIVGLFVFRKQEI